MAACCSPGRGPAGSAAAPALAVRAADPKLALVELEGGAFRMGSDDAWAYPDDGEAGRPAEVDPFAIDIYAVSNDRFADFAAATGYVTDAERYGWSFVFAGLLPDDFRPTRGVAAAPWWRQVENADWRHPHGPQSDVDGCMDHPVVHVSFNDALVYCEWAGARLPTEAEWEFAARGGLDGKTFPWGDELEPGGEHRMNVWQGAFPAENSRDDGFYGTCPVDAFAANGYGLHNVTGNVWEWTADSFTPGGPRVQKGGSYLCHSSYCRRYRVAARQGNEPESSTGNLGFRCAADPSQHLAG